MVERDNIIKEVVKYGGLGDFKAAYAYARRWLDEEGYTVIEDKYGEKISGNAKDIEISWTASKKLTDYYKSTLKFGWRILGMTDVEVEVDGKRKNMNKFIDLNIEIKGTLEKDYDNKWEPSAFQKFLKDIYQKYVVIERTREKEDEVKNHVQSFKEEMKAFFELSGRMSK
jgi:glycogen synthase